MTQKALSSVTLTSKQRRIVDFLRAYHSKEGGAPTLLEISRHLGCRSVNNVRQHLRLIEKKGHLILRSGEARGIRLVESSAQNASAPDREAVPLVGSIAAGRPILAEENIEGQLPLPHCFRPAHRFFALRVEGDSMTGIGIFSGDVAIVEKCESVDDGVVAAVRIGDSATLKRIRRSRGRLMLQAENPNVDNLVITPEQADEVRVEGRLAGVLRCCLPGRQIL